MLISPSNPKVLIAHPDGKVIGLIVMKLSSHFSVDSARNGLLALRKIKAYEPQAILSSFNLPILSGLALLKFIRNHPKFYQTPFIFLDSPDLFSDQALNLGASDFVDSFADPGSLVNKIYHHLHYV